MTAARAQTNSVPPFRDPALEELLRQWRASLATLEQIRTQNEATVLAVERARLDLADTLAQNTSNTVARMDAMSETLTAQRERDLAGIRASNRLTLTVMLSLAGLLFLGMMVLARVSALAMDRLAAVVAALPQMQPPLQLHGGAGEGAGPRFLKPPGAGATQLHNAIERLESRIKELEALAARRQSEESHDSAEPKGHSAAPVAEAHAPRPAGPPKVALTVGQGEALGFLPSEVGEMGTHSKPKILRRLQKMITPQDQPAKKPDK